MAITETATVFYICICLDIMTVMLFKYVYGHKCEHIAVCDENKLMGKVDGKIKCRKAIH